MAASRAQTRTGGRPETSGTIAGDIALSVGTPDKPAPTGWRWTKLSDVARLETGHTPSRRHPEYWDGDVAWIGIKDATENHGRTIYDTIQHTNELGIANSSARILPKNTVCLSRTASVGYVVVMGRPMATSQDFVNWVCSPRLDHRFLKYVLLSERSAFLRFASGTTHQTIYFPEVKAFHICLPRMTEQRAIAHILGTLDDRIEANRRMAATLEEMARSLFRAWFVTFEPVRAKAEGRWRPDQTLPGLPAALYDLFPDRLVETEHGEIPEGWRSGALSDIATLNPEVWTR
jgi:type I restriction enzyme, S subunit